jgi:hypothetical protein
MIWSVLAVLFIMDFFEHKRRGKRIKELENRMDNLTLMVKNPLYYVQKNINKD